VGSRCEQQRPVEDIQEDIRQIEQQRKIKIASKKYFLQPYPKCESYGKNSCQKPLITKVPNITFTMMAIVPSDHEPPKLFYLTSQVELQLQAKTEVNANEKRDGAAPGGLAQGGTARCTVRAPGHFAIENCILQP
jgi:hypothetical protein